MSDEEEVMKILRGQVERLMAEVDDLKKRDSTLERNVIDIHDKMVDPDEAIKSWELKLDKFAADASKRMFRFEEISVIFEKSAKTITDEVKELKETAEGIRAWTEVGRTLVK